MRKLPFAVAPKQAIEIIGDDAIGKVHLIRRNDIAPVEYPEDLQEQSKRQDELQLVVYEAAQKFAQDENISFEEAYAQLFAMPVKVDEDGEKQGTEMPRYMKYLSREQIKEVLFGNKDRSIQRAIRCATLFIRHRILYPVTLASEAIAGSAELRSQPLGFDLDPGDTLKFNGVKLVVKEKAIAGSTLIKLTEELKITLPVDSVLYLVDPDTGIEKVGCFNQSITPVVFEVMAKLAQKTMGMGRVEAENQITAMIRQEYPEIGWIEEDTKQLDTRLIGAIYNFYRAEEGNAPDAQSKLPEDLKDEEETPGKEKSKRSKRSPNDPSSNGLKSSSDSSISDAMTSDSMGETLELPIAG